MCPVSNELKYDNFETSQHAIHYLKVVISCYKVLSWSKCTKLLILSDSLWRDAKSWAFESHAR